MEKKKQELKKVDFRKIAIKNVAGETEFVDISKSFGNLLHSQGSTLEITELGKAIWRNGVVELSAEDVKIIKEYAERLQGYILKTGIQNAIK